MSVTASSYTDAGGNVGAVCFGLGFRELDYKQAFLLMGLCILASSLLTLFISIDGHAGIAFGQDRSVDPETGRLLSTAEDEEEEE